jgi:hypothetical protein
MKKTYEKPILSMATPLSRVLAVASYYYSSRNADAPLVNF